MTSQPLITFNDGQSIPQVGLGVWQTPNEQADMAVRTAIEAGYRHIDTAAGYENEAGVGKGVRDAGVAREEIFITTKVRNEDQGYESTLQAVNKSLRELQMEQVNLCLVHWPSPWRGKFVDTWKALIALQKDGKVRSIGVSNFEAEHLDKIIEETGVTPVLNQIELHPQFAQQAMRDANAARDVATESWSPLGQGKLLENATIAGIAEKYNKTAAQVIIRWHIDSGLIVIPKSVTPERIKANFEVFDFRLDTDDLNKIDAMDKADGRIGPDPMTAKF